MLQAPGSLQLLLTPGWKGPDGREWPLPDSLPGYLLAFLAHGGQWIARDAVAATFWPDRPEGESLHNLRANLHRVRALLGQWGLGDALQTEPRRVRLPLDTDATRLRALASAGDWISAAALPGEALFASLSFRGHATLADWALQERRALAAAWRDAATRAARLLQSRGEHAAAADLLLRLLRDEPTSEDIVQALLGLAEPAGRRAEALAAYERLRQWMQAELRLEPSSATRERAEALRRSEPASVHIAGAASGPVRVHLFGPPHMLGPAPLAFHAERRFQLLTLLALRSGEWVARQEVAALLWPEQAAADGRRNLRHALYKARELPGADGVEATDHALRWNVATDIQAFHEALRERRAADAVAMRRGPLAAAIEGTDSPAFAEWIAAERTRLDAQWHQAGLALLHGLHDPAERATRAQALLQVDPLDEAALGVLLAAEVARGQAARARSLYRDYAARLAEELGIEPPHHLRDLLDPNPGAPTRPAPGEAGFVGRRTELAELGLLLSEPSCRAVTILGPGGMGKSTLARRALAQATARFPGGTFWVDLHDLRDVAAALARLARQAGIDIDDRQDPAMQIARRLQGARTLAVFDNAEHLGELPASLERLLDMAPDLAAVVTSRSRSHGRHERVLPLEGLAVPDEDSQDLEAAASFDAVRLFELRAGAAQRDFTLARHWQAVVEIVTAVGGMPLAIELAAHWVRLLPPEEIARDLREAIDLLERDPAAPGAPARPEHASMRAVLERAWSLLAPSERDAMTALSVFQGGFTHAAARFVAAVPMPVLSSLVDKSMLQVNADGRFDMHPLLAADARARAASDRERLATLASRHAEHFARHLKGRLDGPAGQTAPIVEAVNEDQANCLAAWRQAIDGGHPELVADMHPAWRAYFATTGKYAQSVRHFDAALGLAAPPRLRAALRATLAYFLVRERSPERAMALARESLAVAEAEADSALAQECVATVGACLLILGRWAEAREWIERSLALARASGARREIASELSNLGLITSFLGEFDRAIALYEEGIALQTELGNSINVARAMCNLGFAHVARGDWTRAQPALEQALRYARDRSIAVVALESEFLLGTTLVELGRLDAAERHLEHAREGFRANRNAGFELKTDYYLARIAGLRGHRDDAARGLLAAVRTARERGWTYDVLYASIFVARLLAEHAQPREALRILHGVRAAPHAHAFVGTLVELSLRALPAGTIDATAHNADGEAVFDGVVDHLVACERYEQLLARMQPPAEPG